MIDNSYGLLGVWYTYANLYLYLQYNHFEIIDSICLILAYIDNSIITQACILNNTIIGIIKQLMHLQYIHSPCPI